MNPVAEFGKILGGVALVAGVILLFVQPAVGVVVLLVVGLAGAGNMRRARERRHRELLEAHKKNPPESS